VPHKRGGIYPVVQPVGLGPEGTYHGLELEGRQKAGFRAEEETDGEGEEGIVREQSGERDRDGVEEEKGGEEETEQSSSKMGKR
jgi:hypothetical protein